MMMVLLTAGLSKTYLNNHTFESLSIKASIKTSQKVLMTLSGSKLFNIKGSSKSAWNSIRVSKSLIFDILHSPKKKLNGPSTCSILIVFSYKIFFDLIK